jgi:hypothetical protein
LKENKYEYKMADARSSGCVFSPEDLRGYFLWGGKDKTLDPLPNAALLRLIVAGNPEDHIVRSPAAISLGGLEVRRDSR